MHTGLECAILRRREATSLANLCVRNNGIRCSSWILGPVPQPSRSSEI